MPNNLPNYVLSKAAETDLKEIATYTLNTWGEAAFTKYKTGLANKMHAIAQQQVVSRTFLANYPQQRVTKYRYHYIFYLENPADKPIIIGVIHEKRDIVNKLKNRLG